MCWRPAVWRYCTVAGPHIIARAHGLTVARVSDGNFWGLSFDGRAAPTTRLAKK